MSVHWGGKGPGHVSRWPRGVGAISPYSGATMLLDFLNPVLDPRITFSRGTNATLIDSTGRLTYAPNNLLTWTGFEGAVAGTPGTSPTNWLFSSSGGSITSVASGVIGFSATGARQIVGQTLTIEASRTQIWSVRIVSNPNSLVFNQLFFAVNATGATLTAYANNIVVDTASYVPQANDRLSILIVNGATNITPVFRIGVGASSNATGSASFTQPQAEAVTYQTTPSTYVATTASAYYGPRFDYDPVTLAPRGLLIEEARTNLVTYSDDLSNAAWTKTASTVTANATASPDGTANADKVAEDATTALHFVRQNPTVTAVAHTLSFYAKAAERTVVWATLDGASNTRWFDLSAVTTGGSTGNSGSSTITAVGNGWFRCTYTYTFVGITSACFIGPALNSATLNYAGTAGSGIFVYGAQLEAGSFATSYIPTVASTVTRNADVATMTGTNFSSWYNQSEGTIVWSGDFAVNNSNRLVSIDAGVAARTADIYGTGAGALSYYKTSDLQQIQFGTGVALNTVFTAAVAIKLNDYIGAVNGATGGADTTTGAVAVADRLSLGHWNNSGFLNGHIRTIAYFNTRLPNAQLQTLTAPSLATTLSLDFTTGSYNVGF